MVSESRIDEYPRLKSVTNNTGFDTLACFVRLQKACFPILSFRIFLKSMAIVNAKPARHVFCFMKRMHYKNDEHYIEYGVYRYICA